MSQLFPTNASTVSATSTTGFRPPNMCWAPARAVTYVPQPAVTCTTGFQQPSMCWAPQRHSGFSDDSDSEDELVEAGMHSATTGYRSPNMCWAPVRPRK